MPEKDPRSQPVTELLHRWGRGDDAAAGPLLTALYDQLCAMAHRRLRRERPEHTLETAALVHEAYLRLAAQRHLLWRNRTHFCAIAARMMRRILVNHARDRACAKRGGGAPRLPLDANLAIPVEQLPELMAVEEALDALGADHPEQARVVELRFFGGLTNEEIAALMGVSVPTVSRRWRVARARLYRSLRHPGGDGGGARSEQPARGGLRPGRRPPP